MKCFICSQSLLYPRVPTVLCAPPTPLHRHRSRSLERSVYCLSLAIEKQNVFHKGVCCLISEKVLTGKEIYLELIINSNRRVSDKSLWS